MLSQLKATRLRGKRKRSGSHSGAAGDKKSKSRHFPINPPRTPTRRAAEDSSAGKTKSRHFSSPSDAKKTGIVIGQAPGVCTRNGGAVLEGLSGRRIARLANVTVDDLWGLFDRTNLLCYYPGRYVGLLLCCCCVLHFVRPRYLRICLWLIHVAIQSVVDQHTSTCYTP